MQKKLSARALDVQAGLEELCESYINRTLNDGELKSLKAVILHKHTMTGVSQWILTNHLCSMMGVDEMGEIKSADFQDALEMLIDYKGVN